MGSPQPNDGFNEEVSKAPEGRFNPSYLGVRMDLFALLEHAPVNVLDIGCSTGANAQFLRGRFGSHVTGIELDPAMADIARERLHRLHVADLNRVSLASLLPDERFDLIVLGDVLEHLVDPWTTLREAGSLLQEGGVIVTSLPNVGHYSTLLALLVSRRWPYRERGIHDQTHLRFFTRLNLLDLYASAGLIVRAEARKLRLVESPSAINRFASLLDFPPFRSYFTFQYIHRLSVDPASKADA